MSAEHRPSCEDDLIGANKHGGHEELDSVKDCEKPEGLKDNNVNIKENEQFSFREELL